MKKHIRKAWGINRSFLVGVIFFSAMLLFSGHNQFIAYGENIHVNVTGKYYEFDEKNDYKFTAADSSVDAIAGKNTFGTFSLSGTGIESGSTDKYPTYSVNDRNLEFSYTFNQSRLNVKDEEWHLVDDKSKNADTLKLDKNIMKGALIVQSSSDGEVWTNEVIKTDVFTEGADLEKPFYSTKDIQLQNGCFFRVIVVYKMEIKTGSHKFAFVSVDDTLNKRVAEVYTFQTTSSNGSSSPSPSDAPRKDLGRKISTGKNNGYSGNKSIKKDDPHYGWDLGNLFVNGYTREVKTEDGTSVFLKNSGDRVALWFNLKQDIKRLNGNSELTIAEDVNGYDKEFEVPQTNFGHGTLIVRYTDHEGVRHDPIIYKDYLLANARTGADTIVQLFEEGDYEVALDYRIKNNPRQLGQISIIPSYTDYKILTAFSIRNGNNMVYPFDAKTNTELSNQAITENGFKLDMAKSRYLTVDVTRSVLKVGEEGTLTEDVRFSRPSKDGDTYTEDGIYTFTVKNLYTSGEPTTKTIYVGTNKYLRFLSKSGLSVSELNEKINRGAVIADDGTLVEQVKETLESKNVGAKDKALNVVQKTISKPFLSISIIAILGVILALVVVKQKLVKQKKRKDRSK